MNSSDNYSAGYRDYMLIMASSLPFVSVNLDESEVPGAVLTSVTIEQHTVVQLERWLQCRGVTSSGKKADLIAR